MAVIADFKSYPQWAKGVQKAEVVEPGDGGRAEQVYFALDVSPIKDEYTLAYDWDGDREVTWTLVEGKMLKAMDGAYELVCPPELEASIHLQNAQAPVWQILPSVAQRTFVISSDPADDDADPPGKVCALLPQAFGIGAVLIAVIAGTATVVRDARRRRRRLQ